MSSRHQEGLAHLLYGITVGGGFVALTGEVGTGKTTLCQCLMQELPENIDIALILNPKMNAIELLASICDELAIAYNNNQPSLKTLVDTLNQYLLQAHAHGRRTVLMIDEAQNLSMEVLEQIRLLTNLETTKSKLLQIVLVGQPELKQLLKHRELRQLNQRITARYHLLPLSLTETRSYIKHRLRVCNGNPALFKEGAIRMIYRLSAGIPRIINILCDRALLGAYANDVRVIGPKLVQAAARETLSSSTGHGWRLALLLSLLLISSILFGWYHSDLLKNLVESKTSTAIDAASAPDIADKIKPKPIAQAPKFDAWIANPELTLTSGLINSLQLWKHTIPTNGAIDCDTLAKQDFNCMFGKTRWKELLAINRPVILEISLSDGEKRHVLLTGLHQERPVLFFDKDVTFPLADVLSYWDGYFLILWRLPIPGMKSIYPGETSESVLWLRQRLAMFDGFNPQANNPRYFDHSLKTRVQHFQHQNHLSEDGIAGLQTLFFLDNQSDSKEIPRLITKD